MDKRESEIDNTHIITANNWTLTLVRKANSALDQHAFIIIEGIQDNKAVIHFLDFVGGMMGPVPNSALPNINTGRIRHERYEEASEEALRKVPLIFRCTRPMMDIRNNDALTAGATGDIDPDDASKLIKSILADKEKPPVFNIFGKESIITGSSALSSSKERGDNCFTYAKRKIDALNIARLKIQCPTDAYTIDKVASITSLTLTKSLLNKTSYISYYWKPVMIVATAALVAGVGKFVYHRHHNSSQNKGP